MTRCLGTAREGHLPRESKRLARNWSSPPLLPFPFSLTGRQQPVPMAQPTHKSVVIERSPPLPSAPLPIAIDQSPSSVWDVWGVMASGASVYAAQIVSHFTRRLPGSSSHAHDQDASRTAEKVQTHHDVQEAGTSRFNEILIFNLRCLSASNCLPIVRRRCY